MNSDRLRTPPKQPYRSTRVVSTPSLAAANAAESPAGPPPNTKTSVSAIIGVFLGGSSIYFTIYYLYTKI